MQFCPTIPNSSVHFAVGDIAEWSGIKRVGHALSMWQCAAVNIVKLIDAASSKQSKETEAPELQKYPCVPPMIALALGSTALTYHPDMGMSDGPEVHKNSFGTDLGLSSKLAHPVDYYNLWRPG